MPGLSPRAGARKARSGLAGRVSGALGRTPGQVSDSDQVVRCESEHEHPIDTLASSVSRLPKHRDRLRPSEDLLDELPLPLTDRVALVPGGAAVDRRIAPVLGGQVRCDPAT